jgi:hypothetical protein
MTWPSLPNSSLSDGCSSIWQSLSKRQAKLDTQQSVKAAGHFRFGPKLPTCQLVLHVPLDV